MPRLPQLGELLSRVARGGVRPPTQEFPQEDVLQKLVASRVGGPSPMPQGGIPPMPGMTPAPMQEPVIPSMFQRTLQQEQGLPPDIYNAIEPTGSMISPERGLPKPKIFPGSKAEAPSKAQLKALVERLLGRQVAPTEKLGGEERNRAIQEIMNQGQPQTTTPFTNLMDVGRSSVTGMPVTNTPGGRALRLPVEDARVLALQNPERFQPGGFSNYGAQPVKSIMDVPPGSPEDIIGGIGLQKQKFEPLYTPAMKKAMEHLGKAETEASGYALPKPANVVIATAQGFKIFDNLLKKGTLARQWDEIYQNAVDTKPHIVGTLSPQEYFVEAYQKMTMARGKFQPRFKDEFRFIGGLGQQMRSLIAPEAQLAEKVKTPMEVPKEGEKTSFQKSMPEGSLTGPGIPGESRKNELVRSQESKTFKKFFDGLIKEAVKAKKTLTPEEIKTKWQEYLNQGKSGVKGALPPLTLGGIGYGMGSE